MIHSDVANLLHNLHFSPERLEPVNTEGFGTPLPHKVYQTPNTGDLVARIWQAPHRILDLLVACYGVTRMYVYQDVMPNNTLYSRVSYGRNVPSGGKLYPNELYLYVKNDQYLPAGLYYFDASKQCLIQLRTGEHDEALSDMLFDATPMEAQYCLFVTTAFYKNFHRYQWRTYRLQALDSGVLLSQLACSLEAEQLQAHCYCKFNDEKANRFLGIDGDNETCYAMLAISASSAPISCAAPESKSSFIPCFDINIGQQVSTDYSILTAAAQHSFMTKNDMLVSDGQLNESISRLNIINPSPIDIHLTKPLTESSLLSLHDAMEKRQSPGEQFEFGVLTQEELATIMHGAFYRAFSGALSEACCEPMQNLAFSDLLPEERVLGDIEVYACVNGVRHIQPGLYRYVTAEQGLSLIKPGQFAQTYNAAQYLTNIDCEQVPLCLHLVASRDCINALHKIRCYRIQQMLVGAMAHKVQLVSTQLGLAAHIVMGFDINQIDALYELPSQNKTALLQVAVGYAAPISRIGFRIN